MASNSFGNIFKITTWGESHGKAIGVVIDGCPAGLEISDHEINAALSWRAPGRNNYTSPRMETDQGEILSGVFEGKTTGAPICIIIPNNNADSSKYEPIKDLLRPGHANYTYLSKYGIFDYRGGGRASARETAGRVAAGALAKKLLTLYGIAIVAYVKQIGKIESHISNDDISLLTSLTKQSPIFCPDAAANDAMLKLLDEARQMGNSLGGVVEFKALSVPCGLGDPVYEKLEANLACAMLSLPASKGFELGSGFKAVEMNGSQHNDLFVKIGDGEEKKIETLTNNAGGTLGGISSGMPVLGRVAFKPTASIRQVQDTLTIAGEKSSLQLPEGSKHDPCVAIRAVPIVEAMLALVLVDALLLNRCVRL